MKLEDEMQHLRMHEETSDDRRSDAEILAFVKTRSEEFDRSIRRRDRRELIAGAFVFAFFSIVLVSASWLTRAGAAIVLGGCISTYVMLRRAKDAQPTAGLPLTEVLRSERAKVDAQIHLLRRILWWYVAPFAVGPVLVFVGIAGFGIASTVYTVLAMILGAVIHRMNQQAVRSHLIPRRDELDRLLRQVER